MVTLLQKAERLPDGRVKGVGPPQLWPKVVRRLTSAQQMQIYSARQEQVDASKKMAKVFAGLGLDPRKNYRFNDNGEVIEIGSHVPKY